MPSPAVWPLSSRPLATAQSQAAASATPACPKRFTSPIGIRNGLHFTCGAASCASIRRRFGRSHAARPSAGRSFSHCFRVPIPVTRSSRRLEALAIMAATSCRSARQTANWALLHSSAKAILRSPEDRFALRALAGTVFDRADALCGRLPPKRVPEPPPRLTERERECLRYLIAGGQISNIAAAMGVSQATVRFHSANLRMKTGAANRAELAALAISLGLTQLRTGGQRQTGEASPQRDRRLSPR